MPNIRVERAYYENGKVRWEGSFDGDKLDGPNRHWHENGVLSQETFYLGNLEHGIVKQWDQSGKLLGEYHMERGTGVHKSWHENGRLACEVSKRGGQWHGRFRCWDEDGEIVGTECYIANKKISKKKYDQACKTDPTLPRYDDDLTTEPVSPPPKYQKRITPISEPERYNHEKFIAERRTDPNQAEARKWLAGGADRFLGDMSPEESRGVIEEGYKAGAVCVIAVGIQDDQTTDCLIVELPAKGNKRRRVFEWNSILAQKLGWDPYEDWGQTEIFAFLG